MKWTSLLILLLLACQPSVRYSPAPPGPASIEETGYGQPDNDGVGSQPTGLNRDRLSSIIENYIGTPYRRGGFGKLGIDCSGLVYAVYRDYDNMHLPPNAKKLFNGLPRISYRDVMYGDLVFFSLNGKHASHVGIYIGDNKFVHSSESRGVVISSMKEEYYRKSFVGARRVLG